MRLCEQDIRLLKYLHAVKVATYRQIHRDIYPDLKLKTVYNRVAKITKLKLISSSYDRLGLPVEKVMSVSKQGFNKFVADGKENRIELKSDAIIHDIGLVDIRHVMTTRKKVLSYHTENQIQTWWKGSHIHDQSLIANFNSDAIALISLSDSKIWASIEYEASKKAEERYEAIVKKYYQSSEIPLVLYICEDEGIMNQIKNVEKKYYDGQYPKLFYQLKQNIIKNDEVLLMNRDQKILEFETKDFRESFGNC